MSDDDNTTVNVEGLDKLLKALKAKLPVVKIGVLGNSGRSGSKKQPTNAQIGVWHEFGTKNLPQRSFLRVPLADNLAKELESSGALDESTFKEVIKEGTIIPWMKKVAVLAEGIVAEAFATGGFGKWKPSDMRHKKNHQTLVETQQLRDSITSEVKE